MAGAIPLGRPGLGMAEQARAQPCARMTWRDRPCHTPLYHLPAGCDMLHLINQPITNQPTGGSERKSIMEVQDRRIRRTQHLLAEALIALTLEKDYESVTIRDITARADIGYATFFRHYRDKDELLKDVLDVVLNELLELVCVPPAADPTATGLLLFRYVQEHEEVVRVLLKSHTLRQNSI